MQRGEEIGRNPAAHIRGPGTSVPIHTAVMILLVICSSLVSRLLGGVAPSHSFLGGVLNRIRNRERKTSVA